MINVPNSQLQEQICLANYVYDPIGEPTEMLHAIFKNQDLETYLHTLKHWKKLVSTYAYFEVNTFDNPLYEHKMMCNLLNAAWLLQRTSSGGTLVEMEPKAQEVFLNRESLHTDFYIRNLSMEELIDPLQGVKNFFKNFTLQESHQQLYQWLNVILSPNVNIPSPEAVSFFYKNFRKLIECCWLIYNRKEAVKPATGETNDRVHELSEEAIPEAVLAGFRQFLSVVPAQRLNRGLRKMLVDYLFYNMNGLPTDFEELLTDFYWLTDLLDEIQGKAVDPKFM